MREIKFRAWDKSLEIMYEVGKIDLIDKSITYLFYGKYEEQSQGELILMQFTGLQDKKGVDIYEGDIVNLCYEYFDGHYRDNECVGKVFFEGSSFRMNYKKYEEIREWLLDEPNILSIEVIGNIYENPELLEEE